MNKINITGRVLPDYNRQTQYDIANAIEVQINQAADGYLFPVYPADGDYTITLNDSLVTADATAGNITITLRPADECEQKLIIIKKTDASANTVTVAADGSETIDGAATNVLAAQYDTLKLMSDGNQWLIV